MLSTIDSFKALGVIFGRKLAFEKYIHSIVFSVSQKAGILHKCFRKFGDKGIMSKYFYSFLLPCLEYWSPVWSSAADSHLRFLDKFVSSVKFLIKKSLY